MDRADDSLDQNTRLALQRSFLSTERTLMAWIRTSISMIGFGFTLAKLFQSLAASNVLIRGPAGKVWTAEGVGMLLISLGTFALIVAVFDHYRELKQLQPVCSTVLRRLQHEKGMVSNLVARHSYVLAVAVS